MAPRPHHLEYNLRNRHQLTTPNLEVANDPNVAYLYTKDRKKFNETAAEWTRLYAT